tara:strand:- start:581 stop:835 length:255 start_codon:yes stop_codon:yes gene_type:complete
MLTFFLTLVVFGLFFYFQAIAFRSGLDRRKKRIEFLEKQQQKLVKAHSSCYNSNRDKYIKEMTHLKLVYNSDTDEWDKLKELEE